MIRVVERHRAPLHSGGVFDPIYGHLKDLGFLFFYLRMIFLENHQKSVDLGFWFRVSILSTACVFGIFLFTKALSLGLYYLSLSLSLVLGFRLVRVCLWFLWLNLGGYVWSFFLSRIRGSDRVCSWGFIETMVVRGILVGMYVVDWRKSDSGVARKVA